MRYATLVTQWLEELGYTHCFFVAGGNSMHLLDAIRQRMRCVPTVHEVAAGIAAEYFNEAEGGGRAFVLVSAGPGLTNLVTALAGAYLESRELLVIGGQVKSTDLASKDLRQRGIQEVDGVAIAAPFCVATERVTRPIGRKHFYSLVQAGRTARQGPVFIEMCLDTQGAPIDPTNLEDNKLIEAQSTREMEDPAQAADRLFELMVSAKRPLWLIGGGVRRTTAKEMQTPLAEAGIPLMTTWNGMDRLGVEHPLYFGRPNTWGQRSANVLLAQADLVIALGTRLGLQQTGFNWKEFVPNGIVAQVELDPAELKKGHPKVKCRIHSDANAVLSHLVKQKHSDHREWVEFCRKVHKLLPTAEVINETAAGYLDPFEFVIDLSRFCAKDDIIIPCSSGGAFTVMMQAFEQKFGQTVITDKGLASMGYGLSGAIGAAFSHPGCRTVLVEGDGGFAQNLQELATLRVNDLPIKIFIFANEGYASIRLTQRNYSGGEYIGCDTQSGLGFPNWTKLFESFEIPTTTLAPGWTENNSFKSLWSSKEPTGFIVPIDPEQTYYPKISSRITESGSMESNPIHLMSPELPHDVADDVFVYIDHKRRL